MKVVFLDFDGVLNSDAFFASRGNRYGSETLDPAAVARVNAIVARTGARVVVSSTWRLGYTLEGLREILGRHGLAADVVDATPVLASADYDGLRVGAGVSRAREIQGWLDAQPVPPEAFVVLDDDPDLEHLTERQVRTELTTGLRDEHIEPAVRLLGEKRGARG